jgi:aspartate-semialdehyde dehydrogenase
MHPAMLSCALFSPGLSRRRGPAAVGSAEEVTSMTNDAAKLPVAVLGATGIVGQRLVASLAGHPWFELAAVAASERRVGAAYGDSVEWKLPGSPPAEASALPLCAPRPDEIAAPLVFSALDASVAGEVEDAFAEAGHAVVSNARSHRFTEDVPLVIPEVNPDHLELVEVQRRRRRGFIATNPNCSTIGLALALAPLQRAAGVEKVVVTTLQASSGAGFPGVPSMDLIDNVVPGIGGEEGKIEREPLKIFGALAGARVTPAQITISSHTHRVPVSDGHLMAVSLATREPMDPDTARSVLAVFEGEPQQRELPSAPERPVVIVDGDDRPQPRLDRHVGSGMAVAVGRVRPCPVLGLRLELLSHNTLRGAAGGTLLIAELLVARGLLP